MKSYMASPSDVERKWYVVDAEGKTLGRLASEIANVLRGKNKPIYTPHIDTGDYVIVVNAERPSEDLLSSFRVCRRYERDYTQRDEREEARVCYHSCSKRYASKGTFGKTDA